MTHLLLALAFVGVGFAGVLVGWFFRSQDCEARHADQLRMHVTALAEAVREIETATKPPPPAAPVQLPPSRRDRT